MASFGVLQLLNGVLQSVNGGLQLAIGGLQLAIVVLQLTILKVFWGIFFNVRQAVFCRNTATVDIKQGM
jgi:hypothetical protein